MKLILFILINLVLLGTALGQFTTLDSTEVCYTAEQDTKCLECLIKAELKDSLIRQQAELNLFKDSLIIRSYNEIEQLKVSLYESNLQSEKRLKWIKQGSLLGLLLGVVLTVLATS